MDMNGKKGTAIKISVGLGAVVGLVSIGIAIGSNFTKVDAILSDHRTLIAAHETMRLDARRESREYTDQKLEVINAQYTEILRRLDRIERGQ